MSARKSRNPTPTQHAAPATAPRFVVEYVSPRSLVPDPANPRVITDDERAKLKRGMQRFGIVQALVARAEDRMVIGGNQKLDIAIELGYDAVPVTFLDLTRPQATALGLLLNNPKAQGKWDDELLRASINALRAEDFDVTLTGFDSADISRLMQETRTVSFDVQKAPSYVVKVTCTEQSAQLALAARLLAEGFDVQTRG